ncbi:MAG: tetratricopeptide repeat protein [Pseudomonadota bacterium]|nr:tetratricopeptide repeat protein [Pseudomonadota bacterium]
MIANALFDPVPAPNMNNDLQQITDTTADNNGGTWGLLLLATGLALPVFTPYVLPVTGVLVFALLTGLLGSLFAFFWIGYLNDTSMRALPLGRLALQLAGSLLTFGVAFAWWFGPLGPMHPIPNEFESNFRIHGPIGLDDDGGLASQLRRDEIPAYAATDDSPAEGQSAPSNQLGAEAIHQALARRGVPASAASTLTAALRDPQLSPEQLSGRIDEFATQYDRVRTRILETPEYGTNTEQLRLAAIGAADRGELVLAQSLLQEASRPGSETAGIDRAGKPTTNSIKQAEIVESTSSISQTEPSANSRITPPLGVGGFLRVNDPATPASAEVLVDVTPPPATSPSVPADTGFDANILGALPPIVSALVTNALLSPGGENITGRIVNAGADATTIAVPATLNQMSMSLLQQGALSDAEAMATRSLEVSRTRSDDISDNDVNALNLLAAIYREQGRPELARAVLFGTLDTLVSANRTGSSAYAVTTANLATPFADTGQRDVAETLLRQSSAQLKGISDVDPQIPATVLNNLALVLQQSGRLDEAQTVQREAVDTLASAGGNPQILARLLANLAEIYRQQQLSEAEPLLLQALALAEDTWGPGHPETASILLNLASFRRDQGETQQALPLYRRALEIWDANLIPEHPKIALALYNLATTPGPESDLDPESSSRLRQWLGGFEEGEEPTEPLLAKLWRRLNASVQIENKKPDQRDPTPTDTDLQLLASPLSTTPPAGVVDTPPS